VANVAAWFVSLGWNGMFMSASTWTIVLIALATIIYLVLVLNRNMREAALVGIWALVAIAVRQWQVHDGVVAAALIGAAILLALTSWHGVKNWKTSPLAKLRRGEV
jgi:uncharacterized membrane protein YjjB (DUF3815 family)